MYKRQIEKFEAAGRNELAEQEKLEADILEEYLPTAMTEDEISKLIEDTIQEVGASSRKDMGQVMKLLQNKTQGRVDNKTLSSGVMDRLT